MRYAVIHKPVGQTPLERVEVWKKEQGLSLPAAYAGRLDPMAHGKLLVLLGDECKKQKSYTGLDKEYVIEVVLDIETDTGDALGIPHLSSRPSQVSKEEVLGALQKEHGTHLRSYPVFSSKTVKGKPLFMYALEGTLGTIRIPEHLETIFRISLLSLETIAGEDLEKRVNDMLALAPTSIEPSKALGADFRIGTIRPTWNTLFETSRTRTFQILTLRVTSGSGAYMRTLARRIGEHLGTTGFALSIERTKIGSYLSLPFGFGTWTREYS